MALYYSPMKVGFFDDEISPQLPTDAVALLDEDYHELRAGLDSGKVLQMVDGTPSLADKQMPNDEDRLTQWRATVRVTRTKFCLSLKRAGILSPEDAVLAAKGGWPGTFTDALDALPADIDRNEAQIVWAAVSEIYRNDPVLAAVQAFMALSDDLVDALFGGAPAPEEPAEPDPAAPANDEAHTVTDAGEVVTDNGETVTNTPS